MSDENVTISTALARRALKRVREVGRDHDIDRQLHELIGDNPEALARHASIANDCADISRQIQAALILAAPIVHQEVKAPRAPQLGVKRAARSGSA